MINGDSALIINPPAFGPSKTVEESTVGTNSDDSLRTKLNNIEVFDSTFFQ